MLIDFPGIAANFDDIPPGGFFMFNLGGKNQFGLCVTVADTRAAIIFSHSERHHAPLWLAEGDLPINDTLISFPSAVMRPELSSVSFEAGNGRNGAVMSAAGSSFYMRVPEDLGNYRTFNLQTCAMERPTDESKIIHFERWQVGLMLDQKFETIFSFPIPT